MPACQFKTWFVSKRYGYGAGIPICWQVGSQLGCWPRPLEQQFSSCPEAGRVIVIGVSIVVFLVVCCLKTECGWRWRCGDRS